MVRSVFAHGLRPHLGCGVDLFKPTALQSVKVVNITVLPVMSRRPPTPPETFPEPFPERRTQNTVGGNPYYLQVDPPPGNIHDPRGEFSYITSSVPVWYARLSSQL